mmetsp:Transcript_27769/g.33933  ORF Transcript_27769/g.33933 Transcript_27769/m.33933 type:complete len:121 (+) Transcript_27769:134-496(+)
MTTSINLQFDINGRTTYDVSSFPPHPTTAPSTPSHENSTNGTTTNNSNDGNSSVTTKLRPNDIHSFRKKEMDYSTKTVMMCNIPTPAPLSPLDETNHKCNNINSSPSSAYDDLLFDCEVG